MNKVEGSTELKRKFLSDAYYAEYRDDQGGITGKTEFKNDNLTDEIRERHYDKVDKPTAFTDQKVNFWGSSVSKTTLGKNIAAITILQVSSAWAGILYEGQSPLANLNIVSTGNIYTVPGQAGIGFTNNESVITQIQTEPNAITRADETGINSSLQETDGTSLQYTYPLVKINLRSGPSINSSTYMQLEAFSQLEIQRRSKKETVNNFTDYWYEVKVYKEDGTPQTGFVFGHFLSAKLEGRKAILLKFTRFEVGDMWHYLFTDVATNEETEYDVSDLFDNYALGDENGTINPAMKNRLFKAVINVVPGKVYEGEEYFQILPKRIVVDLKLVEK